MTTNFTLTKKIKENLAYDLTAKAVEKKMKALEKKLIKLNQELWEDHDRIVGDILQIDKTRYQELQVAGALVCTSTLPAYGLEASKIDIGIELSKVHIEIKARLQTQVTKFIHCRGLYSSRLSMEFSHNYSVPTVNRDVLKLADSLNCRHYRKAEEVIQEYIEILKAAAQFHSDTLTVIGPIRAYNKLIEHFPEAAKMITVPEKAKNSLVPTQLINDVRERLKSGVPN